MKIARRKFPYRSEEYAPFEFRFSRVRTRTSIRKAHNGRVIFICFYRHGEMRQRKGYLVVNHKGAFLWDDFGEWGEMWIPAKSVAGWAYVIDDGYSRRKAKKESQEIADYYPIDRRRERRQRRKEAA